MRELDTGFGAELRTVATRLSTHPSDVSEKEIRHAGQLLRLADYHLSARVSDLYGTERDARVSDIAFLRERMGRMERALNEIAELDIALMTDATATRLMKQKARYGIGFDAEKLRWLT